MADLRETAVSPHTMQGGQAQAPRGLAATALDPLRRAYQAYQQYVGQPFQQAVRGGVRGYFGLPMMSDADALGREAYRQAEALGYTPGVGMPAGAVRLAAEGVQALPSIAGDIGRVIAGMPSSAGAAQAEDFARYQRSISPSDVSPLTAFHGTPYTFEPTPANPLGEFRAAKIGSGEGAQAYGYGLYFAEAPGVAKGYQTDLSRNLWKQNPPDDPIARATLERFNGDIQYAKDILKEQVAVLRENFSPNFAAAERGLIALENYKPPTGSLYTVDIPDSMIEKMLDWDKPLSEQKELVKNISPESFSLTYTQLPNGNHAFVNAEGKILGNLQSGGTRESFIKNWMSDVTRGTGRDLYRTLGQGMENDPKVASALRNSGIPGIRYLDAGSRGSADGTRNIVVFPGEESKVKILKRE